jgi:hypothetical protein
MGDGVRAAHAVGRVLRRSDDRGAALHADIAVTKVDLLAIG